MSLDFPENEKTINRLVQKLQVAKQSAFKNNAANPMEKFTEREIDLISKYFDPEKLIELKEDAFVHRINEIVSDLNKIPTMIITLAFEPSLEFEDRLLEKVSQKFGSNIKVQIQSDKSIVGGLILQHGGIYENHSVKEKILEIFKD